MRPNIVWCGSVLAGLMAALAPAATAQPLGTFKWQLQPYCNVITLAVTANDGVFRLEGTDDQCGAGADRASAAGTAFPNPDGTIGFGLTVVTSPGGTPVHVDAALAAGGFDGTWKDSAGNAGTFRLTPGAGTGGARRPLPPPAVVEVPPAIQLRADGGFTAVGGQGAGAIPASGQGTRLMWHPAKSAFRAGAVSDTEWDDVNIGRGSAAVGERTVASGIAAFAAGDGSRAIGHYSTALGSTTEASGIGSTSAGSATRASGDNSTALGVLSRATNTGSTAFGASARSSGLGAVAGGLNVTAAGDGSVAVGELAVAEGNRAVALGYRVTAAGNASVAVGANAGTSAVAAGSMVFGDFSIPNVAFQSVRPNEFLVRAAGGYALHSNAALSTGVRLAPGANAWSSLSDVNAKENFRELSGGEILDRFAAMPVREWNYRAQDAAIRHMGPTAQDFHAAFGLGEDPLRISTIDADGVALAGVKALDARTRALAVENSALRSRVADLASTLEDVLSDLVQRAPGDAEPAPADAVRRARAVTTEPAAGLDTASASTPLVDHLAWTAPILALIGLALAWLLATAGPIV